MDHNGILKEFSDLKSMSGVLEGYLWGKGPQRNFSSRVLIRCPSLEETCSFGIDENPRG